MNTVDYPDNIIGILFRLLEKAVGFADRFIENLSLTPFQALDSYLVQQGSPDWLVKVIGIIVEWTFPLRPILDNFTIMDLLIGWALGVVLIIGFLKYFGDLIGL